MLLALFAISPFVQAQSDFFSVWPGHPEAPPRTGPEGSAAALEWTVGLNMRGIAANNRAVALVRMRLPEGERDFIMRQFNDIAGFEPVGEDDFQIRPGITDREISYNWYGESGTEQLTIAVYQGVMSATLTGGEVLYSVSRRDGAPLLQQLDVTRIPPTFEAPTRTKDATASPPKAMRGMLGPTLTKSALDVVDVLILHTPAALAQASIGGDQAVLNSRVAESFLQVESAMATSGMNTVRLRNVISSGNLSVEMPYNEVPGNSCIDPDVNACRWIGHRIWLRTNVQALRNAYGADLVVLLLADQAGLVGVAYPQHFDCGKQEGFESTPGCDVGAAYEPFAVAALSVQYATSFQVFAHETGHQFGMQHQAIGSVVAAYPWSLAKTRSGGQSQTVVGGLSLVRSLQYSNPNVFFIGTTDSSGASNRFNARTGFCLAPAMSGFRTPGQIFPVFWDGFETRLIPADGC